MQIFSKDRFDVAEAGIFPAGFYNNHDIKDHHIDEGGFPGGASSLVVPTGLNLTIYDEDHFRGK